MSTLSERAIIETIANAGDGLKNHPAYLTKTQIVKICKEWLKQHPIIKIDTTTAEQAAKKWHSKDKKPKKIGVYHTSKASIAHLGGALGYWDGKKWNKYQDWGDYLGASDFIWRGDGEKRLNPVEV